ncbi:ABC-type transport system, involved in lipoprotein release, permease component [hydrothermal vent metagenome]|uniref:ABC-type transport system, involved in lipoprotein release, permease component n=1 Tax=hydrothermal vent metagenome TaxID=652676 RepID=A0A3B1EAD4_9ZZZZ
MKIVKFAIINLLRNKKTNFTTALLIIFGTSALLFALGFIKMSFFGLGETMVRQGIGHFQIMNPNEKLSKGDYPLEFGISSSDLSKIKTLLNEYEDDIETIMPRLNFSGIISNADKSTIFLGKGVDTQNESVFSSVFVKMEDGKNLGLDFDNPKKNELILGSKLAQILDLKVGDTATLMINTVDGAINAMDADVSGIFSTGKEEIDKRLIMVPIDMAKELMRTDKISKLVVGLYKTENSINISQDIKQKLQDTPYSSYFWEDLAPFYRGVVNLYNTFFIFLGGIILIVVISSVLGSVSVSVAQRTSEFGMLKANGFSTKDIMLLVLSEIFVLSLVSVIISLIITHISMSIINVSDIQMAPPPGSNQGYPLLFDHIWLESVIIAIVIVLISLFASIRPSFIASRLKISDALRS